MDSKWRIYKGNVKTSVVIGALALGLFGVNATVTRAEGEVDATTTTQVVATTEAVAQISLTKPKVKVSKEGKTFIAIRWKRVNNATSYDVLCKTKKGGDYKKIDSTSKTKYTHRSLKKNHSYSYRIVANATMEDGTTVSSKKSRSVTASTKKTYVKTAYVGDSVMSGMQSYGVVGEKNKKVIAKIGVSTWNFWRGSIMDDLLNYNADRVYIMLGMNSLGGTPNDAQINTILGNYKRIINDCKAKNSDIQIVVLPVSPTRPGATVSNSAINKYNQALKKMAKKKKVYYYDYTDEFKDAAGNLKSSYSGGDGIHWTSSTYQLFKKKLDAYGKKLDE